MAKRFSDALDKKLDEFERPKILPEGYYHWTIVKSDVSEIRTKDGRVLDSVSFLCRAAHAVDVIDEDALAEFGDVSSGLSNKQFMIPDGEEQPNEYAGAMFRLRQFLETCGADPDVELGEQMATSADLEFIGELAHRPDKNDPSIVYTEIKRTLKPE